MVKFADISEYYTGDLAAKEEQDWIKTQQYKRYLNATKKVVDEFGIKSILEIGCGTGFIPTELSGDVKYMGVDKNQTFLDWAKQKNQPDRQFVQEDVRSLTPSWLESKEYKPDLVVSFAFLKHFGLDEWNEIVTTILKLAPMAIIEMQVGTDDLDNGKAFHHVFVTQEHIDAVIEAAGHTTLSEEVILDGITPECEFTSKMIVTKKV